MMEDVVNSLWRDQEAWSRAANRLKARITRYRLVTLTLSIVGAILETLAATQWTQASEGRALTAFGGAVCLAFAAYCSRNILTVDALRAWTRARSVSEGLKAEIYTFRARAKPYHDKQALTNLIKASNAIQEPAQDLLEHVHEKLNETIEPLFLDKEEYIKARPQEQIDQYYIPKKLYYSGKLNLWRRAEFLLGLISVALGVAASAANAKLFASFEFMHSAGAWVAVCTTLSAAVGAHAAANRYDFLVMSYGGTARRLEHLIHRWRASQSADAPEDWSNFVRACEDAISVENESWLAKWMTNETPNATGPSQATSP